MAFRGDLADRHSVAVALLGLSQAYRDAQKEATRKWACKAMYDACRQLEHFVVPEVSVAAQRVADVRGAGPLHQYRWKDQTRRPLNDKAREIFHFEHVLPVSVLRDRLLKATTLEDVERLVGYADVAWILKEEDRELRRRRFRSNRPENPWDAYRLCNIEMVKREGKRP